MQYSRATCLARDYTFPSAKLQLYSVFTKFICCFSEIVLFFLYSRLSRVVIVEGGGCRNDLQSVRLKKSSQKSLNFCDDMYRIDFVNLRC